MSVGYSGTVLTLDFYNRMTVNSPYPISYWIDKGYTPKPNAEPCAINLNGEPCFVFEQVERIIP